MSVTINKFDSSIAIVVDDKSKLSDPDIKIFYDAKYPYLLYNGIRCALLPGDWHLLFKGSEATEEDAKKVVDEVSQLSMTKWYMCYHLDGVSYGYSTALEALKSLLRANGIHLTPQQDVIILKNEKR